jgi:hypothetical protein
MNNLIYHRPAILLRLGVLSIQVLMALIIGRNVAGAQSVHWETHLSGPGTFASARTWDLNQDGVKDVVIADGREFDSIGNLTALNGVNGAILWEISRVGELFASAQFMKINGDEYEDVVMAGRLSNLFCVDGLTGDLLWDFDNQQPSGPSGWLQFYEPKQVMDVSGDGLGDIVVVNGGDPTALPGDPNRPPGILMLIDASDGSIINSAIMPDTAESYCSVTVINGQSPSDTYIYFGSGGETVPGSLWKATLAQLQTNDISGAVELMQGQSKGFIAPPVLADINSDNTLDILGVGFEGKISLINGVTETIEWTFSNSDIETYAVSGIGDFNGDGQLDVASSLNHGVWPVYDYSVMIMLDGANGNVLRTDTIGLQVTSPMAYDLDGDDKDEVMISYQIYDTANGVVQAGQAVIHYETGIETMFVNNPGLNIASSASLDDLDNDGDIELIEIHSADPDFGFDVQVWNTGVLIDEPLRWTAYHGTFYDGIYYENPPNPVSVPLRSGNLETPPLVTYLSDRVEVQLPNKAQNIQVVDLYGKTHSYYPVGLSSISVRNLAIGIYFLSYDVDKSKYTTKLFVK